MGGIATGVASKRANDATDAANRDLTSRMEQSRDAYAFLRPQAAQSAQNIAQRVAGAYTAPNNMLGEMTGGKYKMDLDALTESSPLVMKAAPNAFTSNESQQLGQSPTAYFTALERDQAGAAGYDTTDLQRLYEQQGGDRSRDADAREMAANQERQERQRNAEAEAKKDPFAYSGIRKPR